ncbi:hypothetical protein QAD02_015653 [Eretmocerus hayati]|uniref:Uncharacterized protein n=1 Tax=Eretmocerus hayati TaxID=131215 RepID=A0ACC2P8V3_9HYME|nr:hypothetical protein QAD02_015653 [Eretmocerus hayati]
MSIAVDDSISSRICVSFDGDGNVIQETSEESKSIDLNTAAICSNKTDPLVRISFKDEIVYKKYHSRIIDIVKFILTSEPTETQNEYSTDVVLDVTESSHDSIHSNDNVPSGGRGKCDDFFTGHKRRLSSEDVSFEKQKKSKTAPDTLQNISVQCGTKLEEEFHEVQPLSAGTDGKTIHNAKENDETRESTAQIDKDTISKNSPGGIISKANLKSKYVLFDSYLYSLREESIFVTENGLSFSIPIQNCPLQNLFVELNQIRMVWLSLYSNDPTVYLYLSPKFWENSLVSSILPGLNDFHRKALLPVKVVLSEIDHESMMILEDALKYKGIILLNELYPHHSCPMTSFSTPPKVIQKCVENSEMFIHDGLPEHNATMDNAPQEIDLSNLLITLHYSTVRVGSHEVNKPGELYIMNDAIRFWISTVQFPSRVMVRIRKQEINNISYNFSGHTPVLFVKVASKNARAVRTVLKMKEASGRWFDPRAEESINKITFILQNAPPFSTFEKQVAKFDDPVKLDDETANQILSQTFVEEAKKTIYLTTKCVEIRTYSSQIEYGIMLTRKKLSLFVNKRNSMPLHLDIPFINIDRLLFCLTGKKNVFFLYISPSVAQKIENFLLQTKNEYIGFEDLGVDAHQYLQRMTISFNKLPDIPTTLLFERIMRQVGGVKIDKRLAVYLNTQQKDFAVEDFGLTPMESSSTVIIGRYKFLDQEITYDKAGIYMKIWMNRKKSAHVPITIKFTEMLEIRECFDTHFSVLVIYCSHSRIEQLKPLGDFRDDIRKYDLKNEMQENRRIIILFHHMTIKESAQMREILILSKITKEQDFSLNKQMLWKLVPNTYIRDIDG